MKISLSLIIISFIFPLFFLNSCVENFEVNGGDNFFVVNCVLVDGEEQSLYISDSYKYGGVPIQEASIKDVTSGDGPVYFTKLLSSDLYYSANLKTVPGHKYYLKVVIDDNTTISASTVFPEKATLLFRPYSGLWDTAFCSKVSVAIIDASPLWLWGTYQVPAIFDPTTVTSTTTRYIATDTEADSFNRTMLQTSDYFPDSKKGIYFRELCLRLCDLSSGDSFSVLPYSSDSLYLRYENRENVLRAITVSSEYDTYLRALFPKVVGNVVNENNRPSWLELYSHNNMYTNIHGGTGIFGAYSTCLMTKQ